MTIEQFLFFPKIEYFLFVLTFLRCMVVVAPYFNSLKKLGNHGLKFNV